MKIAFFNTKEYDREFFDKYNEEYQFEIEYFKAELNPKTAKLAYGSEAVCAFVNDNLGDETLTELSKLGVKLVLLRCAGFNNCDLGAAKQNGLVIMRVPEYSPFAVAKHAVGLILSLSRKFHKAYNRTRDANFSLEGLMGFDLHAKTVGVIGTGKIGLILIKILNGFGVKVLAYDPYPVQDKKGLDFEYCDLKTLYVSSDIITLQCPLTKDSFHMVNSESINDMKDGVIIINTSRGALINAKDMILGLKNKKVGGLAIDVYEEESEIFFKDMSSKIIEDDTLMRLMSFPNVLVTGHQAFFTDTAMENIAKTTLANAKSFQEQNYSVGGTIV